METLAPFVLSFNNCGAMPYIKFMKMIVTLSEKIKNSPKEMEEKMNENWEKSINLKENQEKQSNMWSKQFKQLKT